MNHQSGLKAQAQWYTRNPEKTTKTTPKRVHQRNFRMSFEQIVLIYFQKWCTGKVKIQTADRLFRRVGGIKEERTIGNKPPTGRFLPDRSSSCLITLLVY